VDLDILYTVQNNP